jgi:hypothetical protein
LNRTVYGMMIYVNIAVAKYKYNFRKLLKECKG